MINLAAQDTPPSGEEADLKTYIINLERDELRRQAVLHQCNSHGLDNVEIVAAIDGAALSTTQIERVYSSEDVRKNIGRELCRAEIGCALSHLEVCRRLVRDGAPIALVIEDDIRFGPGIKDIINAIVAGAQPGNWEVLLLGHHSIASREMITSHNIWSRTKLNGKYSFFRPSETAVGAYGYLVNQRGAARLLDEMQRLLKPVDHYTGSDEHLNVYVLKPPIIHIDEHLSDFHHNMHGREQMFQDQRSNKISGMLAKNYPVLFRIIKKTKMSFIKVWTSLMGLKKLEPYR